MSIAIISQIEIQNLTIKILFNLSKHFEKEIVQYYSSKVLEEYKEETKVYLWPIIE